MKRLFFIAALVALMGCGTQPELSELVDDMVVLTNFDTQTNFDEFSTYILNMDTIGFVSNTTGSGGVSDTYGKLITARIKSNLDATGHTQVADEPADIAVNVVILNNLSVTQSVYYPSYGYPGYGYYGGYYGYGPIVQQSISQQAILVIEFLDIKHPGAGDPITIWSCNIGDLVSTYDRGRKTEEAIDQAFVQSAYLTR